jgi:hypothetical protein
MTALNDQIATLTADIATTRQKLAKNAAELVRVDAVGGPARKTCQSAQDLRQQRADILSRLIVSGSNKLTSRELDAVDAAIEASRPDERRAEDLLSAQASVLQSLREEGAALEQLLAEQTTAVLLKKHEAARLEIEDDAVPAVSAAIEVLRVAYGRLSGLRTAHAANADLIKERCGVAVRSAADKYQPYAFNLTMHGMNLPLLGRVNAASECRDTCRDALHRWGTIGDEVPAIHDSRVWPPLN